MYKNLREFIAQVDGIGALRRISGADPRFEIGGITEVAAGSTSCPALLFETSPASPGDSASSRTRQRRPSGRRWRWASIPACFSFHALRAWKEKRATLKPIAPVEVKDTPLLENIMEGDGVDLRRFPAPHWHRHDGGPYIGSGSLVITGDPDSSWINASIYRVQVHDAKHITVQFDHLAGTAS